MPHATENGNAVAASEPITPNANFHVGDIVRLKNGDYDYAIVESLHQSGDGKHLITREFVTGGGKEARLEIDSWPIDQCELAITFDEILAMRQRTEGTNRHAVPPAAEPHLDDKGHPVRVGAVVCVDGPEYGRVESVTGGAIAVRVFDWQRGVDAGDDFRPMGASDCTVVMDPPAADTINPITDPKSMTIELIRLTNIIDDRFSGLIREFRTPYSIGNHDDVDAATVEKLRTNLYALQSNLSEIQREIIRNEVVRDETETRKAH